MTKQHRHRFFSAVMAVLVAVALLAGPFAGPAVAGCCDPAGQQSSAVTTAAVMHHAMKAKAVAIEPCHAKTAAKLCQGPSCGLCVTGLSVAPLAMTGKTGPSPQAPAPVIPLVGTDPHPTIHPPRTAA